MSFHDDLELVMDRTGHAPYRAMTDPDHPEFSPKIVAYVSTLAASFRTGEPLAVPPSLSPRETPSGPGIERRTIAPPATLERELALVRECPHRGPVLPISQQREGCGRCGERSECRAGKGPPERPNAVVLAECLICVGPPQALA